METKIITLEPQENYELIDSGDGEKLERYGDFILRRPDPQALWKKHSPALWQDIHASFIREGREGSWVIHKSIPERWGVTMADVTLLVRPTAFKHTGVFPEQASNWEWVKEVIATRKEPVSVLNLFGYTGGASLSCAKVGAKVCHVDASKASIGWAKDNAEASGLADKPIRWILDDAKEFVKKELRRGNTYDAIIMDPPAFGRGPEGEIWQVEDDFVQFVEECKKLLSPKPLFFLVNGYASGYSQLAYRYNIDSLHDSYGGIIESGEITIRESHSGRMLPCGIFARWRALR